MRRGDPDASTVTHAIRNSEARLEEAVGLARAIDLTIAEAIIARSARPPATYLARASRGIVGLITARHRAAW